MLSLRKTLETAHIALEAAGIDHALIGGLALASLGINRATADVDLLIDGASSTIAVNVLNQAGFTLKKQTPEVLHLESTFGYLDILLANRPLSKAMLSSATIFKIPNIKCLGPEDLIGLKIQAYFNDRRRELKDKADIQSILRSYPSLDLAKVKSYADVFNEWPAIEKLRST